MFTATESKNDTPTKPGKAEITWNPDTNEITTTTENSIWKPNTDQVSGKYVWMTTASYNSAGNIIGDWGRVICITGDSGENGADGLSTEFIYRLIPNESNFSELKTYLTTHPLSNTSTGEVPSTDDTICDSEWTNHPTGIDGDTWYMEVVCVRTKTEDGS